MAEEQDKKIKDLEASLARELDQQVNLSAPTDPRIGGVVDLNPTLNLNPKTSGLKQEPVSTPEVAIPDVASVQNTAKSEDGEVSLDDLDALLKQEMPELEKELNTLREAGKDLEGKDVNIGAFDVSEDVEVVAADELPKKISIFSRVRGEIKRRISNTYDFLYHLPFKTYKYTIHFAKNDGKRVLSALIERIKRRIGIWVAFIKDLNLKQRLIVLSLLLLIGAIAFLVFSQIVIKLPMGDPYLESFAEHVQSEKFDVEKKFVPLSEEGQYPEYVVLLDKVVVNIKPSQSSSSNPMVAMRLYFEVTSREAAVEMKDREKEMRDLAQRVLEGFTYDQIISAYGKKAFKEDLRKEMSSILNNGLVKNVFIDDILLKP